MIEGLLRNRILGRLERLQNGALTIVDRDLTTTAGRRQDGLHATVAILSPRVYRRLLLGGGLGAAESYLRGEWIADDLVAALRIFARNIAVADRIEGGLSRIGALAARVAHRLRRNSRRGSRKNIRDHYDLGNDLFALFLDPTLTYSCGIFEGPGSSLEQASVAKLDGICRTLGLSRAHHVLEIGTGWGSFAIHAAREYGCRVTTTTISASQHALAARRIHEAGLSGRVTLLRRDYRDLSGRFDRVVSIEMIEAVGHEYLDDYFGACGRLLVPNGEMLLQAIVMPDHRYEAYRRAPDFIQRYVFPGSALPSIGAMQAAMRRASDFGVVHVEDITEHYVTTLRRWRESFMARIGEVKALGYDDRFVRLWEYYLAYCEAGFAERHVGTVQMLLTRPGARRTAPAVGSGAHDPFRPETVH